MLDADPDPYQMNTDPKPWYTGCVMNLPYGGEAAWRRWQWRETRAPSAAAVAGLRDQKRGSGRQEWPPQGSSFHAPKEVNGLKPKPDTIEFLNVVVYWYRFRKKFLLNYN
jgi:hypothetical protein